MTKPWRIGVWIGTGVILIVSFVSLSLAFQTATERDPGSDPGRALAKRDPVDYEPPARSLRLEEVEVLADGARISDDLPLPEGRALVIRGDGFFGTAVGPFVRIADEESTFVYLASGQEIYASVPDGLAGEVLVRVTNPDGRSVRRKVDLEK